VLTQHFAQVLRALEYLHKELHVIHRDIKPSNVLVSENGCVKLTDFGVSGQLASTVGTCASWLGTVTYMSPERIQGRSYTILSDIWSFGLTIVELALGAYPYTLKSGGPVSSVSPQMVCG
jgi:serine/threonine protein kinase